MSKKINGSDCYDASAYISECGNYRYHLTRTFIENPKNLVLWIMLNPSTADAFIDDPTIRRCIAFSKLWGYDGLTVANLYAYRSSNPKNLWLCDDPVGNDNDSTLRELIGTHSKVICAWGANAKSDRVYNVVNMLTNAGSDLYCLGITKNGSPKHPLYISSEKELEIYKSKK